VSLRRKRLKGAANPECKAMSRPVRVQRTGRRTETAYKAKFPGELAQHKEALGSGDMVNAAVV